MFTVMVGLLGSGNSRTCRPLASSYSVMPSTEVSFFGAGSDAADAVVPPALGPAAFCATAGMANATAASPGRRVFILFIMRVRKCAANLRCIRGYRRGELGVRIPDFGFR